MERQSDDWESRHLPRCPNCDQVELRRHGRVGFLQRTVLPLFGLYPWECGLCRKIYLLRQRSRGYTSSQVRLQAAAPAPPAPSHPQMDVLPQVRGGLPKAAADHNHNAEK